MARFATAAQATRQATINPLMRDLMRGTPAIPFYRKVSPWPVSRAKRCFDVTAVVVALPLVLPVLLAVGLTVRLSSRGPVLFVQTRMGRYGRRFKIFKFRTMMHRADEDRPLITTVGNQRFTPVGRFLRKWKLDELPQILNVLRGDMSLVGPRPKVPDHQREVLFWRPGITGAATLVFACEEVLLYNVPGHMLDRYVQRVVLPAKEADRRRVHVSRHVQVGLRDSRQDRASALELQG